MYEATVTYRSGGPLFIGSVPEAEKIVAITVPSGQVINATSGTKQEYGPGGFELYLMQLGAYKLNHQGELFAFEMRAGQMTRVEVTAVEPEPEPEPVPDPTPEPQPDPEPSPVPEGCCCASYDIQALLSDVLLKLNKIEYAVYAFVNAADRHPVQ